MFWKRIFLSRMMEYQVKFCHHSGLRLWRTRMLFSTKPKGHKSNVHISWMYRYRFYDLKVHFWWPNKRLKCNISSWNTLYYQRLNFFGNKPILVHFLCVIIQNTIISASFFCQQGSMYCNSVFKPQIAKNGRSKRLIL